MQPVHSRRRTARRSSASGHASSCHRRALIALLAAASTVLPGCDTGHPLRGRLADRGAWMSPERTRQIDVMHLAPHPEQPSAERSLRVPPPDRFAGAETVEVSLAQARAWTLEHNLDIQVALFDPQIAGTAVSEEEAAFEALFFVDAGASTAQPGRVETFRGELVPAASLDPGVTIPLRTGGAVTVHLPAAREASGVLPGSDRYWSDIELALSLPLARGGGRWFATHRIRLAALDVQIAEAQTKLRIVRSLADVDRAFWIVHATAAILEIRQQQYEQALAQVQQSEARFQAGLGPEVEVVRAEAGLSRRLAAIIDADLDARDAQRALKRVMNRPGLEVESPVRIVAAASPEAALRTIDPASILEAAMQHRMELLALELKVAQDATRVDAARSGRLPLVLLEYRYRIGGSGRTPGRALDALFDRGSDGMELGLRAEIPLGNEAAESTLRRALLARLQRLATRAAREQVIRIEVLGAVDAMDASWQRILAARQNVVLEARNYQAEQGQFRLGLRTSTEVLDAETRLADARIALVDALAAYEIAQVDLAHATGLLLGATRVAW